uniref:Nucleolar protein 56 n=1 Tax=Timspurckia oligopyrenoides TaxID=708627 RepID=A0A7S0ZAE6_9RHOD|mmetsp:Transcript_10045/g.18109  ORF Transcript_10045/g.18109 Transcript_10045/m.18109 type:complete len:547 (+) Transcript_10045:46-1686(+)
MYILFESASGYALLEAGEASGSGIDFATARADDIASLATDSARVAQITKVKAFAPFASAEHALENASAVSEGLATDFLHAFLSANLPISTSSKKSGGVRVQLGVSEPKLGSSIQEMIGNAVAVESNDRVLELLRAIRAHFEKLTGQLSHSEIAMAQRGLAHAYSRSKVKFNVHKSDNMIIQSIALLDQLDKDVNTFSMRVREWYSWHFPELVKIVPDNQMYAKCVALIRERNRMVTAASTGGEEDAEMRAKLLEILADEERVQDVISAAKISMGTDVSAVDMINIERFATRVVKLGEFRGQLQRYLTHKMGVVAPNLRALLGDAVAARLIAHAGSLTNLAKYPASTVQILGAEKALFRALKTKGKTPKYGLLFNSTFIGRAKLKNKGRISRYLANKSTIASRVDCFGDYGAGGDSAPADSFGRKLREQVEQRLEFYETGAAPRKNLDMMKEAVKEAMDALGTPDIVSEKKKKKKSKEESEAPLTSEKEKKKSKKRSRDEEEAVDKDEMKTPDSKSESKSSKKNKKESSKSAVKESRSKSKKSRKSI